MSGSSPIVTNSVVPIANPPVASAIRASARRGVGALLVGAVGRGRVAAVCTVDPCRVGERGANVAGAACRRGAPAPLVQGTPRGHYPPAAPSATLGRPE